MTSKKLTEIYRKLAAFHFEVETQRRSIRTRIWQQPGNGGFIVLCPSETGSVSSLTDVPVPASLRGAA